MRRELTGAEMEMLGAIDKLNRQRETPTQLGLVRATGKCRGVVRELLNRLEKLRLIRVKKRSLGRSRPISLTSRASALLAEALKRRKRKTKASMRRASQI